MPDRHVSFADDRADGGGACTTSGFFTVEGARHHGEIVTPVHDEVSDGAEGKVIPFNRGQRQPDSFIKVEIAALRRLLEQVINFRGISTSITPVDQNAAEIALDDSDIRIGVRLHQDGADDHWEVWVRSEHGSLNVFPDKTIRLQFLSLSLSVMSAHTNGSASLRLGSIAHSCPRGEINQAHVQLEDSQITHNLRIPEAVSAMRTVYGYILRSLPFDTAFQQLVG
jgi:hypothetical protein